MPWQWLRLPARVLGALVGSVLRIRRRHAVASLAAAGLSHPEQVADGVYQSLALSVFELLWLMGRRRVDPSTLVEVDADQWERVQALLRRKRGLVVATAHTGNWDLLACAMAQRTDLSIITKHLSWKGLDRFWQQSRRSQGVGIVDASGAIRASKRVLERGGAVAFLIDQAPVRPKSAYQVSFAKQAAWMDGAFAIVAAKHRAPVVLAVDERLATGRHRLHVLTMIEPPERGGAAWAQRVTSQVNAELDKWVRDHPEQWLWLHRRWKPLQGAIRR